MAIFTKKIDEVIDLREMQKRGILRNGKSEEDETFVFPSAGAESSKEIEQKNAFASFWDTPSSTSSVEKVETSADLSGLNVKIENLEYKLERFLERLEKIEEKLEPD